MVAVVDVIVNSRSTSGGLVMIRDIVNFRSSLLGSETWEILPIVFGRTWAQWMQG